MAKLPKQDNETIHSDLLTKITDKSGAQSRYGDLELVCSNVSAIGPDGTVELKEEEFQVLWVLVRSQGAIVSRLEVTHFVYGDSEAGMQEINSLYETVSHIRDKLEQVNTRARIRLIHGRGYRMEYR